MPAQANTTSSTQPIDSYPSMELLHAVTEASDSMTVHSDAARHAIELATGPIATARTLTALIEQDIPLQDFMRLFGFCILGKPTDSIQNLESALSESHPARWEQLIHAASFGHLMRSMRVESEWVRDSIWRHSVVTGAIASRLNRSLEFGFQGEEFTAGLTHDLGRLLVAATFPSSFSRFDPVDFDESGDVLSHEDSVLGSNHCDLGGWFAAHRDFPDAICDVIRDHHTPMHARKHRRLVALTTVADHMANHYQQFHEIQTYQPELNPGVAVLAECGQPGVAARFEAIACSVLADGVDDAETMTTI